MKERQEKMQMIMDKMSDGIKDNSLKAKQLLADQEYVKDCIHADEQHARQLELEKEKQRQRNLEVKYVLESQVHAKRQMR